MSTKKGERVGAILKGKGDTVHFIGYGKYIGDEIPGPEVKGFNFGIPNPKIILDDGGFVFGCECWWGPEKTIKRTIETYKTVIKINMEELRK